MKLGLLLAGVLILLMGYAEPLTIPHFYPAGSQAQFNRDSYECNKEARTFMASAAAERGYEINPSGLGYEVRPKREFLAGVFGPSADQINWKNWYVYCLQSRGHVPIK